MIVLKTKKIMITVITFLIALVITISILYVLTENAKAEDQTPIHNKKIERSYNNFENFTVKNDKLKEYKFLEKSYNDYKNSKGTDDEIVDKYEKTVKSMRDWLVEYYEKKIDKYTIKDDSMQDLNTLKNNKEILVGTISGIKVDKVLNEDEIQSFKEKITDAIKRYDARMKNITEAEKQAKKQ